jgi:hypothetical protein
MQKYYLNNREVSEEEFYSTNNLSVSNPFRGEKQVNQAVKEAIGLSTRHKANTPMIHLDEAIEQWKELIDGAVEAQHGVKETEGKADYSEINLNILDLMSERMQKNKYKYPPGNSKKPIDLKSLEWALFRHIKKMVQPIENDPESYTEHLAAILCNSSIILDQLELKNK